MNTERIKELAKEAGYYLYDLTETDGCKTVETYSADEWITLEKFAELIAAEEREACAKVCEDSIGAIFEFSDEIVKETASNVCINLAKGIRARGKE